jgi:4'-phosphopantetheinyl transferase EntD
MVSGSLVHDNSTMSSHAGASLQTYLDAYLPRIDGVTLMAGEVADHVDQLADEERPAIAKAIGKRQWEFATGRFLAKQAMRDMGITPVGIRRDAERRPVWPKGCIGSITHAGGLAVAAVGRQELLGGVGIDLEEADRVTPQLYGKIFTDHERTVYEQADSRWPGLLFSAKEAGYKAVNPLVGKFIGFHEAEIDVDWQRRQFAIRYVGDHEPNSILDVGQGHFGFFERYVFSLFIIP